MLSENDFVTKARYRRQIARRDETIARLRRSMEYIQRHVEAISGHSTARYSESWRIADRALNARDEDSGEAEAEISQLHIKQETAVYDTSEGGDR